MRARWYRIALLRNVRALARQRGASIMELTVVITLFLMLAGVLNRTELSPDGASIFSGFP
jgi:hypothetical protein